MLKWVWLAACFFGVVAAAVLLTVLWSMITGRPARSATPEPCALALRDPRPAVALQPGSVLELARVVWGESRSESLCGQVAVAYVVINRMLSDSDSWDDTVAGVSRQRRQFSIWGTKAQRSRLERLTDAEPGFLTAQLAASLALTGAVSDPTSGATYFVSAAISVPRWARGMIAVRIGGHVFMRSR